MSMSKRQHQHRHQHGDHCAGNSCSHSRAGHAGDAPAAEQDFNEILEDSHPCCQKDAASKARALKLRAQLDKVDPSQIAERTRKAAFSLEGALADSELPDCRSGHNGADYPALQEARRIAAERGSALGGSGSGDRVSADYGNELSSDEDDNDDDLNYLLDDPELLRMEQARVEGMQADAAQLHSLRALGFGLHLEVPESQIETTLGGLFRGAGVVIHFYDGDSDLCASLDLLLEQKAGCYMGTRFVRCRLRTDSGVARRINVRKTPSLACYKGDVRVAYSEQLSQFGDAEGVDPGAVERWLAASGTLELDPPNVNALRDGVDAGRGDDDGHEDEDDSRRRKIEERYDCGLDGCSKSFAHDHFLADGGGGLPQGFGERV